MYSIRLTWCQTEKQRGFDERRPTSTVGAAKVRADKVKADSYSSQGKRQGIAQDICARPTFDSRVYRP